MILPSGKYYLYRHVRLDTNEVLYIGIGTKKRWFACYENEYRRAFSKSDRNRFWKNVVNLTEFEVEIMMESNDYSFIKRKEREFVKLYGRRDLNKGELVNLTDGGEGKNEISEETRQRLSKAALGRSNFQKGKKSPALSERNRKTNYWERMTEEDRNKRKVEISNRFKGRILSNEHLNIIRRPVIQMALDGSFIKEWNCAKRVKEELGISHVTACCKCQRKTSGGFRWKYKIKNE